MTDPRSNGRGGRARRPYHHGALRKVLVASVIAMVEEGGVQAINLREAARRAGVSSGAPFRHFENKEALLAAVAVEIAARLDACMMAAANATNVDDPLERFQAMGIAYVVWAVEHKALFGLLHSREHFKDGRSGGLAMLERSQRETLAVLIRSADAGDLSGHSSEVVVLASHALVYGLARLLIDGVFVSESVDATHARALATAVTGVLGRGLGAA